MKKLIITILVTIMLVGIVTYLHSEAVYCQYCSGRCVADSDCTGGCFCGGGFCR